MMGIQRKQDPRAPTRDELKSAALICFRNAEELLADADLLHREDRQARAIFLACIGIEELGKASLAIALYEANWQFDTPAKTRAFWQFWRDHMSKAAHGEGYIGFNVEFLDQLLPQDLPEDFASWREFEEGKRVFYGKRADALTKVKMASLYTDFIDRDRFGQPSGFRLPSRSWRDEHAAGFIGSLAERIRTMRPEIESHGWLDLPPYPPEEPDGY